MPIHTAPCPVCDYMSEASEHRVLVRTKHTQYETDLFFCPICSLYYFESKTQGTVEATD